jgi:hypothetical protein
MANSNGWGDGAANNTIGWGQGANNAIGWGKSHSLSYAGRTDIVGTTVTPPVNTVAPVVTGPNPGAWYVGDNISTSNGTWTGSPTFTYQWRRQGEPIENETSSTYVLQEIDIEQEIKSYVTGTNAGGSNSALSSNYAYILG